MTEMDKIGNLAPGAEPMDLEAAARILTQHGWACHPIDYYSDGSAELQFWRPDAPEHQGLCDTTGHIALFFYDDWELLDELRSLMPALRMEG